MKNGLEHPYQSKILERDNQEEASIIAVVVLSLLLMLAPLVGCDQARGNFDMINVGMSRVEVEKLLGQPARVEGEAAKPVAYWTYGDNQLVVQYNKDKVQVKQVGPVAAAAPTG